jgi:shikimate dehydrogenase/3-dehydroquinate dehydratase type I
MILRVPQIVASLPARTLEESRVQLDEARRAGADLAEIRFDRWIPSERDRVGELFPAALPMIGTLRSRAEGGEGPDDPEQRAPFLSVLRELPFAWVDLETKRDGPNHGTRPLPAGPAIIRSTHYPPGTPMEEILSALQIPPAEGSVQKLVVPASTGEVLTVLLPILRRISPVSNRVVHTTGGSGALLRALAKRLGMPMVYGRLPGTVRPGTPEPVESAQVPVDRLRRFFQDPGRPPLFAVVGRPVAHSLSPEIQHGWFAASGRVGLYVPLEVGSEGELRALLGALGELGLRGVNVTHPWKAAALTFATRRSAAAEECAAANCLTLRPDGWEADNTDLGSIRRRLEELRAAGNWDGDRVTVLGAGGAARATVAAAVSLGARTIVLARRREQAEEVARRFGSEVGPRPRAEPSTLVVNATSAGQGDGEPLAFSLDGILGPGSTLLDWVYRPSDPHLAALADKFGATYESGERLLVYQAASSFAHWWGAPPSIEAMQATLEEVGCAA